MLPQEESDRSSEDSQPPSYSGHTFVNHYSDHIT